MVGAYPRSCSWAAKCTPAGPAPTTPILELGGGREAYVGDEAESKHTAAKASIFGGGMGEEGSGILGARGGSWGGMGGIEASKAPRHFLDS